MLGEIPLKFQSSQSITLLDVSDVLSIKPLSVKGGNVGIQAISSSTTAVDMSTLSRAASASASTSQVSPPQKTGAAPPVGNVAKPVAASDSTSSSNSAKIYDKRDTNQDGTVSYQEELLYALKSPATEAQSQSAVSAGQMQSGLKAYQQIQQASGMTTSTSLFAI